jgi:hypothetical protein
MSDGPIVLSSEGADEIDAPVFESLEAMLETIAECYATGLFGVNESGIFKMDGRGFADVARKYNPNLGRWRRGSNSSEG